ncbi:cold shock and DUF1294 domain-containing protein [Lysobacter sp. KIS68-7]|uniref:DUF1294 domain-containing protein n=1 Tax=Lysobacter sp. KIS68-7 TaxID=2904252 RepID=UPI001E326AFD|nr:cold shock and DUF1294 domain-containing protein [Lysobacter sp. KIS68-7]UHQ20174.1 cold shock and DUF1294 domain-containing protein [Lysobacter sp. KIS68-7]
MRYVGRLTNWNDQKGYGFVEPNGGGDRAFVHVKAFGRLPRRPNEGDLISYKVERDAQRRANAVAVRFAIAPSRRAMPKASGVFPRKTVALVFALALGVAWWFAKVPAFVPVLYAATSLAAYSMYWRDKVSALRGEWRTPENTLHAMSLVGGWPGALVAQDVFRHKSSKRSFQLAFWATVVFNCAALYWLLKSL